jgi:hypothetical protein
LYLSLAFSTKKDITFANPARKIQGSKYPHLQILPLQVYFAPSKRQPPTPPKGLPNNILCSNVTCSFFIHLFSKYSVFMAYSAALQSRFAKIEMIADNQVALLEWLSFVPSEFYREILINFLSVLKTNNCKRLLINNKKGKVVAPSDQMWLNKNWLPESQKLGFEKVAVIRSKDAFASFADQRMFETLERAYGGEVSLAFFDDQEEAIAWLTA